MLSQLIEALQILLKYGDPQWPTHCEHDVLTIVGIEPADVSDEDKAKLEELGFPNGPVETLGGDEGFYSHRYGSA